MAVVSFHPGATKARQGKAPGPWVCKQRSLQKKNQMRLDRKELLLDRVGFTWKLQGTGSNNTLDKQWRQRYEQLVELKRKNGHCMVPSRYEQDIAPGKWVVNEAAVLS
jgi:hypothetical protein